MTTSSDAGISFIRIVHASIVSAISELKQLQPRPYNAFGSNLGAKEQDLAISDLNAAFHQLRSILLQDRNKLILPASLPIEILTEIFIYAGHEAIFMVASVCHSWRAAALQYPRLWQHVLIEPPFYASRLMIERSAPIAINMHFGQGGPEYDLADCMNGLNRAKSICSIDDKWLAAVAPLLNQLESLHLIRELMTHLSLYMTHLPNLRHLKLTKAYDILIHIRQPWPKGLRTLHLDGVMNLNRYLELLRSLPYLEEFLLVGYDKARTFDGESNLHHFSQGHPQPDQYSHPSLKRFGLRNKAPRTLASVVPPFHQQQLDIWLGPYLSSPTLSIAFPTFGAAYSVWIDYIHQHILYQRSIGLIQVDFIDGPNDTLAVYPLVELGHTKSLYVMHRDGMEMINLDPFANLEQIILDYRRYETIPEDFTHNIIREGLTSTLPQLNLIGLNFRSCKCHRTESSLLPQQQTCDNISARERIIDICKSVQGFLDEWFQLYGIRFPTVQVYDETGCGTILESMLSSRVHNLNFRSSPIFISPPEFPEFNSFGQFDCRYCLTR